MRLSRRVLLMACFGCPALILGGAYGWLAVEHDTPWLWNVVVHEGGEYTLGGTVLYYGHFLRELPVVLAYALFLLGASGRAAPTPGVARRTLRLFGWLALGAALTLVALALLRAAALDGWRSALLDVAQFRTRDDLLGYGTHWRYHWLSTVWFGAATGAVPLIVRSIEGRRALEVHRRWMGIAWIYFALLTLGFGLSVDVLLDTRHVGHQAREILTHGPITLLLGLGVLILAGPQRTSPLSRSSSPPGWVTAGLAALAVGIPLYLATVGLTGDVMAAGQTEQGLAAMVAAHAFEHSLDYLLALLLLTSGLGIVNLRSAPGSATSATRRKDQTRGLS